jgi:phage gp36-like protein
MPYCTQADIEKQYPSVDLVRLTSDTTTINTTVLGNALAKVSAVMDGFLGGLGRPLPLDPVPELIKFIAIDLTVFELFGHRLANEVPKQTAERHENAMKLLEKIQMGKVTLGTGAAALSAGARAYRTNMRRGDRVFPRRLLNRF